MANNTVLNAMSGGDSIADEDISAVKYQLIKLVDGTAAGTTRIAGDSTGLHVSAHRDFQDITVTSAGLTTATTAYTAGDQVGNQMTFANAARVTGGSGVVTGCVLISAADVIGPFDLVLTDSSVTLAADNAAYAISDADALKMVGLLQLTGAYDIGNNRIAQAYGAWLPYQCSGNTSLFGGLITRSSHTFFAAVTDIQVILLVERN